MADDLQDLEDLLASKGWAWLQTHYESEWGATAFLVKLERIANGTDDSLKKGQTEQAWAARRAIEGFLRKPSESIAKARAQYRPTTTTMSRTGL